MNREAGSGHATRARGKRDPVGLGPSLRRAWVGYQQRLDEAMAVAGFGSRKLPDGRVLRMCRDAGGTTISRIGRELGISRQGAGKIVAELEVRGFVSVTPSATNGREKVVRLTPHAFDYLAALQRVARTIERRLRAELGDDAFAGLERLLDALGGDEDLRMPRIPAPNGGPGGLRPTVDNRGWQLCRPPAMLRRWIGDGQLPRCFVPGPRRVRPPSRPWRHS